MKKMRKVSPLLNPSHLSTGSPTGYQEHLSPLALAHLLRDTYLQAPIYKGDLALRLSPDLGAVNVGHLEWLDLDGNVLSLRTERQSIHLSGLSPAWLNFIRPAEKAGSISPSRAGGENKFLGGGALQIQAGRSLDVARGFWRGDSNKEK